MLYHGISSRLCCCGYRSNSYGRRHRCLRDRLRLCLCYRRLRLSDRLRLLNRLLRLDVSDWLRRWTRLDRWLLWLWCGRRCRGRTWRYGRIGLWTWNS